MKIDCNDLIKHGKLLTRILNKHKKKRIKLNYSLIQDINLYFFNKLTTPELRILVKYMKDNVWNPYWYEKYNEMNRNDLLKSISHKSPANLILIALNRDINNISKQEKVSALSKMTLKELKKLAKERNISGRSKLRTKKSLIQVLA